MKRKLLDESRRIEDKIFYSMGQYTQYTIDYFERLEHSLNDDGEEYEDGDEYVGEHETGIYIQGLRYHVKNFLEVCKDGEDKTLFEEFLKFLEELE